MSGMFLAHAEDAAPLVMLALAIFVGAVMVWRRRTA